MSAAETDDAGPEAGPSSGCRPSVAPATASTPVAGPSTLPAAPTQAARASESVKNGLLDSAVPSSQAGWLRFLTLLRELSDAQRLSFTAEMLALESYLTTRLRYELAELNELVSMGSVDTLIANESYKRNDPAIEEAANELMRGVELDGVINTAAEVKLEDPPNARSRVVHVNGLPFLLYVPEGFTSEKADAKRFAIYKSRRRHEVQLNILRTMLVALRTITPVSSAFGIGSLPSLARVDALQVPPVRAARVAANAAAAPAVGGNGAPAQRVGAAIVINLDEVFRMIVPLFFLSLKLAFLLWIFGKHASPRKRMLLTAAAVLWVIYEAWSIRNRRATELRRQREREREEIARALRRRRGDVTPALNAEAPDFGANAAGHAPAGGVADGAAEGRRRHHHRSRHSSALSPKYWINAIASVGLAAEAREMGLARHSTRPHERLPAEAPPTTVRGRAKRASRRFIIGLVLFIGTLIPEVEKRRKRLLEKRERVRSQVEADRLAQVAAAQGLRTANAAPTTLEPRAADAPPIIAPTPTSAVSAPMLQTDSETMSEGMTDPTPTLATAHLEAPLPPASPIPPGADDISLLAPPTPELQTDEEDERQEGDVDEVGLCVLSNDSGLDTSHSGQNTILMSKQGCA